MAVTGRVRGHLAHKEHRYTETHKYHRERL
jgi:hypothetical protein